MDGGNMTGFDFILNFPREISLIEKIPAFVAALAQSKFQPVISTPGLIVYSTASNDQIIVNPMQYRFTVQRQISVSDLTEFLPCIPSSVDTLISGDLSDIIYNLHMVDIKQVNKLSALELTKKNAPCFSTNLQNVVGVGFRFLFESTGLPANYDEFKCEPWLRDPSCFFFEKFSNYNYIQNKDLIKTLADAYPIFEESITAVYDMLIEE